MGVFLIISFAILMLIGLPIGFVLGITALFGLLKLGDPVFLGMLSQHFFSAMNSYVLLALPLFLLVGEIMNRIGLTERLMDFSNVLFGWLRGGLAQVNIVTSIIFGGISGAAVADTAALGSIFIPAMEKEGYDREFSAAVTVASSIIAPIIPPSIIMVIYGALMGVSIAGMFAAGIVPGLMISAGLMIMTKFIAGKRNYPKHAGSFSFHNLAVNTKRALLALLLPLIILGGILGGFVTPTEAAAAALAYALFLGLVVYRNLPLRDLYMILFNTAALMGVIALLMSSAAVLAWLMASEQLPQLVVKFILGLTTSKYAILLLINLFLIVVGMFMDILPALIILAPILSPLAAKVGVDPLHFGLIMCINLNIALMTPPMGGCLFIAMAVSRVEMGKLVKALWPFMLVEFAVLFLVTYIPAITMTVPRLLGFGN